MGKHRKVGGTGRTVTYRGPALQVAVFVLEHLLWHVFGGPCR